MSFPSPIVETPGSNGPTTEKSPSPEATPNNQLALLNQNHVPSESNPTTNEPLSPFSQWMNLDQNSLQSTINALGSPNSQHQQPFLASTNPTNGQLNNADGSFGGAGHELFSFDSPPNTHSYSVPHQIANEPYVFSPSDFPSPPAFNLPSILPPPGSLDELAIPPLFPPADEQSQEQQSQLTEGRQRSASEIAADVDALHASIGALVSGLGMDGVNGNGGEGIGSEFDLEKFLTALPDVSEQPSSELVDGFGDEVGGDVKLENEELESWSEGLPDQGQGEAEEAGLVGGSSSSRRGKRKSGEGLVFGGLSQGGVSEGMMVGGSDEGSRRKKAR